MDDQIKDRLKKLPYVSDKNLYRAICYAVFALEKTGMSLVTSVKGATRHYPVKAEIERFVRMCYAPNHFLRRAQKSYTRAHPEQVRATRQSRRLERELDNDFRSRIND